jgi:hypothetical protein
MINALGRDLGVMKRQRNCLPVPFVGALVFGFAAGARRWSTTSTSPNLPPEMMSAEHVGAIYAARWEVELFFRVLKLTFRLEQMPTRERFVSGASRSRMITHYFDLLAGSLSAFQHQTDSLVDSRFEGVAPSASRQIKCDAADRFLLSEIARACAPLTNAKTAQPASSSSNGGTTTISSWAAWRSAAIKRAPPEPARAAVGAKPAEST